MKICVRRRCPGIGDAVMMEPLIRKISMDYDVCVDTPYHGLFDGQYEIGNLGDIIIDLGNPCPCAIYESKGDIHKGRTQIFMEAAGLQFNGESPSITRRRPSTVGRIGLACTSARYKKSPDGSRDYPYPKPLAKLLSKVGDVTWYHTEGINVRGVRDFQGNISELVDDISGLQVMVAVDSGVMHIAGALGVKVFALFGPTSPWYRCLGYDATWMPSYTKCGRSYCWYEPCWGRYCMSTLKPKDIYEWIIKSEYWVRQAED